MSLFDCLHYPTAVRALGYPREIRGIRRRYRRAGRHWQPHVERCRLHILNMVASCVQRRRVVVMGAGLLHDVPLDELASGFEEVVLVDIVHPWLRPRATRRPNILRVTADVTNTVAELYRVSDEPDLPLPLSKPTLMLDDDRVDLVVSLNLLSQLPCMPLAYLTGIGAHSLAKRDEYARDVIAAHLDYLARFRCQTLLITDIERLKIDMMNRVVERKDLLFGLTLPRIDDEWQWRLAPCPEVDSRHHYDRRVIAVRNPH